MDSIVARRRSGGMTSISKAIGRPRPAVWVRRCRQVIPPASTGMSPRWEVRGSSRSIVSSSTRRAMSVASTGLIVQYTRNTDEVVTGFPVPSSPAARSRTGSPWRVTAICTPCVDRYSHSSRSTLARVAANAAVTATRCWPSLSRSHRAAPSRRAARPTSPSRGTARRPTTSTL